MEVIGKVLGVVCVILFKVYTFITVFNWYIPERFGVTPIGVIDTLYMGLLIGIVSFGMASDKIESFWIDYFSKHMVAMLFALGFAWLYLQFV